MKMALVMMVLFNTGGDLEGKSREEMKATSIAGRETREGVTVMAIGMRQRD